MRSVDNPAFWGKRVRELGTAQTIYELRHEGFTDAAIMDFLIDTCQLSASQIIWPTGGWPKRKRNWRPVATRPEQQ